MEDFLEETETEAVEADEGSGSEGGERGSYIWGMVLKLHVLFSPL